MIPFAQNLRAAGLIAAAMALFGISDAFIKYVTIHLPVGQIMALRGLLMAPSSTPTTSTSTAKCSSRSPVNRAPRAP